jgi:putative restriction endonuclease
MQLSTPNWTRAQTLAALHVYLQLPYGQLHHRTALIVQLAGWIGRTANAVALKCVNLASLDPAVIASGRKGMGNTSALDERVWGELLDNWDAVVTEAATCYGDFAALSGGLAKLDLVSDVTEQTLLFQEQLQQEEWDGVEGETRTASVEIRVNQAKFRAAVLIGYDATCCISGLRHERLLIASHIVPWSEDKTNRLNPQNGLCLSALHDRAFDQGLITVTPDYRVRVSDKVLARTDDRFLADSLLCFDNKAITLPKRLRPNPGFLARHGARFGFPAC